jgi:hypothetical protein
MGATALATACGLSIEEYETGEAGERRFHAWELAEIAKALDVGVGDILVVLTDPAKARELRPSPGKKRP